MGKDKVVLRFKLIDDDSLDLQTILEHISDYLPRLPFYKPSNYGDERDFLETEKRYDIIIVEKNKKAVKSKFNR